MSPVSRYRQQLQASQESFAALLGVPDETYRVWDSGRRPAPLTILARARRLVATNGNSLLPLQTLATEFGIHVRTLRSAVRDGRLEARLSEQSAFGHQVAFASRDAVARFKRTYYRRTTSWNRPDRPTLVSVPDDYDTILRGLRAERRLSQSALAAHIGAASKAVIFQWESRRRRPALVFWQRIMAFRGIINTGSLARQD